MEDASDLADAEPAEHVASPEDSARPQPGDPFESKSEEQEAGNEEGFDAADEEEFDTDSQDRPPKPRPVYQSKTIPRPARDLPDAGSLGRQGAHRRDTPFNLQETLRQIESYAQGLKSELLTAQRQLRQREDEKQHRRTEKPAPIPGDPSIEELNRLNQQLEFRNAELSARIEELTVDSEERAASRNLASDTPPAPDPAQELRVLLGFKLREDFEDFKALEQEKKDLVVQQHFRCLLRHVFEVLLGEGIRFPDAPPEA
jgi:hypothetical protein